MASLSVLFSRAVLVAFLVGSLAYFAYHDSVHPVQVLSLRTHICEKRQKVWDFFSHAENLGEICPPNIQFTVVTPSPIKMFKGALIDYQVGVRGVTFPWRTLISHYDAPHSFVDQEEIGPYHLWHHSHSFQKAYTDGKTFGYAIGAEGDSEFTLMTDEIRFAVPFGRLGAFLGGWFVASEVRGIFDYRQQVINELFPETNCLGTRWRG
eukprot:TRINITY_DN5392_c0_g1_i1.p1 TRINITY_DN5392_c0_g1~~TRINITY_DN5392_c0_g1_i1.p1  ORF type:complete len:208 (+),score=28.95 TRINITY_DN5392_c0_g1_i1:47-670(+)